MKLSYASTLTKNASAVVAATSFGALAEMAGGADRTDINIKHSSLGFAASMAIASYVYFKTYIDYYLAEEGRLREEWFSNVRRATFWLPCCGFYAVSAFHLVNYFGGYAPVAFLLVLLVILVDHGLISRSRGSDAGPPGSADGRDDDSQSGQAADAT
jgi:hypothetical protein